MVFREINNLYLCDTRKDIIDSSYNNSLSTSVIQNKSKYSDRDIRGADEARQLIQRLGFPSTSAMVKLLQHGAITNAPCNSADVYRADRIYGPEVHSLKGKAHRSKVHIPKDLEIFEPTFQREQELSIDIMTVDQNHFLATVIRPLDLTLTTFIKSLKTKDVKKALKDQTDLLKQKNILPTKVHSDGGFNPITSFLNSMTIQHDVCGAGTHIGIIENKIKAIKNRARAIMSSLKYVLPNSLIKYLISFSTQCINMTLTKNSSLVSPLENFIGRKINCKVDLRVAFGDYCQISSPDADNSLAPRTSGAIALLPSHNLRGSVTFFDLNTLRVVKRDNFKVLPITQDIIRRINDIALSQRQSTSPSIVVTQGHDQREVNEDEDMELPDSPPLLQQPVVHLSQPSLDIIETELQDDIENDEDDDDSSYQPSDEDDDLDWVGDFDDHDALIEENDVPIYPDSTLSTSLPPSQTLSTSSLPSSSQPPSIPSSRTSSRSTKGIHSPFFGFHTSISQALREFGDPGVEAVGKELQQMLSKHVWIPIKKESLNKNQQKKIIPSQMFLKQKFRPDGTPDKVKARLVAGGHRQDESLYSETSSPTVETQNIFIECTIAAQQKKKVATADIGAAYLNADIGDKIIHMRIQPEIAKILVQIAPEYREYVDEKGSIIVQLKKSLYGCKQSSANWYRHIKGSLNKMGYLPNLYDPCVFTRVTGDEASTILLYVDDLMIICDSDELLMVVINQLKKFYKEVSFDIGIKHSYLGMTFTFGNDEVKINMDGYINNIISDNNIKGTSTTPAGKDLFNDDETKLLPLSQQKNLHTVVAKLLFLATRVRPDILLVVNYLTTRVNKFTTNDLKKCNRCLKYLNKTKSLGLILKADNSNELKINNHSDASFGVHMDGRSQSASVSSLGSGSFFSASHKQKLTTKSSTEAELICAAESAGNILGVRNYLLSRQFNVGPANLGQDNTSTIQVIRNGTKSARRLKHLNTKVFFLKDYVEEKQLVVNHVPTEFMIADMLTKPLPAQQFTILRDKLLGYDKSWNN
jgi:hypothetical protein